MAKPLTRVKNVKLPAISPRLVFSQSWRMYSRHWWHLVPPAVVLYLGLSLLALSLQSSASNEAEPVGHILAVLALSLGIYWLQAMHVSSVADLQDQRVDESVGETLRFVRRRLAPLTWAFLFLLAEVVAAVVVLVIAIQVWSDAWMLWVPIAVVVAYREVLAWWMIAPAVMLENCGCRAAFRRGRELVKGKEWRLLPLFAGATLVMYGGGWIVGRVVAGAFDNPDTRQFVGDLITDPVVATFVVIVWTNTFLRLRERTPAAAFVGAPPEQPPATQP